MLHRDYEVWISSDGNPLPEYAQAIQGAEGRTIACYVPSEAGKQFRVHYRAHRSAHPLSFRTYLDGRSAARGSCTPCGTGSVWGIRTSEDARAPFVFADVVTTDEEGAARAVPAELGTIEVRVVRLAPDDPEKRARRERRERREGRRGEWRSGGGGSGGFRPRAFDEIGALHEESKKAGAHCVALGEPVPIYRPAGRARDHGGRGAGEKMWDLDPPDWPIARFVFKYRPIGMLQAERIAPPPASRARAEPELAVESGRRRVAEAQPEAGPSKRARYSNFRAIEPIIVIDSDEDDVEVLESELQRLQDRIRRRRGDADHVVKQEQQVVPMCRKSIPDPDNVIELSD